MKNKLKSTEKQYWKCESRGYFKGMREARNSFKHRTNFCKLKEGEYMEEKKRS